MLCFGSELKGEQAQFSSASVVGGVPVNSEDAFANLSVQAFHWVFVPFLEVLVHERAPHFTAIQYNWFNYRLKYFDPDFDRDVYV